jgi:apolipoprotein D and lipocalin family protein
MVRPHTFPATTVLLLALLIRPLCAQTAPAAKFDPNRFLTSWNQIERYPPRAEKDCLRDSVMIYSPSDKQNSLQAISSCAVKDGNWNWWSYRGILDPHEASHFKLFTLWPFRTEYRVLATAPDYTWALVGSTNHRFLWVLARATTLPPDVLAGIEAQATAAGFDATKLKKIPQTQ